MKGKLCVLLIVGVIGLSSSGMSQGFFAEFQGGYGYMLSPGNIGEDAEIMHGDFYSNEKYSIVKGSYGQGMNLGLNLGYMFSSTIGLDIKTSYLLGSKIEMNYKHTDNYGGAADIETMKETHYSKMLRINPSFIISSANDKFSPYAKLGIVFGIGSINIDYTDDYTSDFYYYSDELTIVYNGGFGFGGTAEVGLNYNLSEHFSLIGAVQFISMSYAPTKGEITKYLEDGVDVLDQLDINDKEAEFVNEIIYDSSAPSDPNKPYRELKSFKPFSSVGLNIGIRFSL